MKLNPLQVASVCLVWLIGHSSFAQDSLEDLYHDGKYKLVIEAGSRLLDAGDTSFSTYYLKALSEARLGNTAASISTLEQALCFHQGEPGISRMLAAAYFEAADYIKARELYLELVRKDSADIASWLKLAEIDVSRQQYDRAMEALDRVLQIDSVNLGGILMLGDILDRQNHSGAVEYFKRAYRIYPSSQKSAYSLANWYIQTQKAEEALPICLHMLETDSTSIKFLKLAGYAFYKSGNPRKAILYFRYAAEAGDSTAFTFKFMGISQYMIIDFPGAIESLQTAVRKDSMDAEIHFFLGSSLAGTKDKSDAMVHLTRSLELMQPDPEVVARIYSEQGNIKRLTGEYEEAYSFYDRAWKADPTNPLSLYYMASILDNSLHRSREALADYQRFIDYLEKLPEAVNRNEQIPTIRSIVEDRIIALKEELFFLDQK